MKILFSGPGGGFGGRLAPRAGSGLAGGGRSVMAPCLASVVAWLVAALPQYRAAAAEQILTRRHCVTVWTTDDGLPDNTVGTVARTADGYLWIGTSDRGVARFNGIEFRRISAADSGGVSPARIHRLIRGPGGTFWVSFLSGDVGRVQGDAVIVDRPGDDDREPLLWWLHEALGEHAGNLWFSTNLGEIARRSATGSAAHWIRFGTPSPDVIRAWKSIVMAADHTILGTDSAGGVWRLEGDECR